MELESINKLFLELSQVATAFTAREQSLIKRNERIYSLLDNVRGRLIELGKSKTITVQSDVDEIESLAGMVNATIGVVIDGMLDGRESP